ncbi:AI-2E family transporter [Azospirillum argentinense]|uniref:AI-2E family transporter n=1 Tax=Azospirillum argentinense TaxID=2970906 RepID=UPI001586DD46|nr:AI-2E family transporter [Azospirillum argentinense]
MADFIHDRFMPQADASEVPERHEMSYVRKALVLSMMLVLLIGCFVVLRPFIAAILWAIILSFSTWPLHRRIERALGGRTTLAAAIMTLAIMAILVGPLVALGIKLSENVVRVFETLHAAMDRGLPPLPDWLVGLPILGTGCRRCGACWRAAIPICARRSGPISARSATGCWRAAGIFSRGRR